MNLPGFCIRRPAFTIVISLVLMIIGILSYTHLPVRWIPNVTPPEITISTDYPGANAALVEEDVTQLVEDALAGINGIESIMSTSRQGSSQVYLSFKLGHNINVAVEDIRSSIERIRDALPDQVRTPVVIKTDTNNMPIMFITFYDQQLSQREMSDYADKYVLPTLQTVDGVGNVFTYGRKNSVLRISLDPAKMAGSQLTVDEISTSIQAQSVSAPTGQLKSKDRLYSVVIDNSLNTPEEFNRLIIRDTKNEVVHLREVGEAKVEPENSDSSFRIQGHPALAIGIIPQATANPLDVEEGLKKALVGIKATLPKSMSSEIVYNQADFIRSSIHSVYESLFEAVVFVWFVILLFLCSFRATLIPVITIPVCLISTFSILYLFGFTINTITLMAFVLAIGLVVDDAIVMLENINRHIESGMTPFSAAIKGSKEIVLPIIAMTITLAAVYTPIAFTSGMLGVLFREFTFTLAGAVLISGLVALTLSPMMCARILKPLEKRNRFADWVQAKMQLLQNHYRSLLAFVLQKRLLIVALLLVITGLGVYGYQRLPQELAPQEDMGQINVYSGGPRDASFQYTDNYVKQLEAIYAAEPDIKTYLAATGSHSPSHSFQLLEVQPKGHRKQALNKIVESLSEKMRAIPGIRTHVMVPPPALAEFAGGDDGDSLGLVVMTSNDYLQLHYAVEALLEKIEKDPQFAYAKNKLKWDSDQIKVSINRERAADLHVPLNRITSTLSTLLSGRLLGKADNMDVVLQMNEKGLYDPAIFHKLYVKNTQDKMISLASLLTTKEVASPDVFHRYDRLRADTIYLSLAPNANLANAVASLKQYADETLPLDMKVTFTGEAKSFIDSNRQTLLTLALSLVFIYLVLAAQFESFIDPFIILLTVPFALTGAVLTLFIFGGTLNIYSNIGLITLIGLIAKHGILITEFANREREQGLSIDAAVTNAALLRLRPILMTTAAMVLGTIPLALAFGPGAESRQQVGLVISGGLLFGTFFSLIVIPIAYTFFAQLKTVRATHSVE